MKLKRLRQKGAAYYFDTQAKPRKWIALGSDRSAALVAYDRLLRQYATKETGTVARMLQDFIALPRRANTQQQYRQWVRRLEAVFGDEPADSLTQADIRKYAALCPRKNVRGELSVLRQAYWGWIDAQRLTFNPCAGVTVDKAKKPRPKRDRTMTNAEFAAIYAKAPPWLQVAMDIAYMTSLRVGEVLALRKGDLEESVQAAKNGGKRRFEMTDDLRAVLARAASLQGRIGSVYVLSGRGGQPIKYDTLNDAWERARKAAGVEDAWFHDIRADAATEADRQGMDATKMLGHKSPQTTRTYLRNKEVPTVQPLPRRAKT